LLAQPGQAVRGGQPDVAPGRINEPVSEQEGCGPEGSQNASGRCMFTRNFQFECSFINSGLLILILSPPRDLTTSRWL
jgi:hypothetical protein